MLNLVRGAGYAFSIVASQRQRRNLFPWIISQRKNYLLDNALPWLTFDAIRFLDSVLCEDMCVFEYGSGGSTLFWMRHQARCVSVEHDPEWYELLSKRLPQLPNAQDIQYQLILPEQVERVQEKVDATDPVNYASTAPAFAGYSFRTYVEAIDKFPDATFDVILVDGRARPSCIVHSVRKVKPGGLLIVDNADRAYYFTHTRQYLESFERKSFYGVGPISKVNFQTDVYLVPNAQ